MAKAKVRQRRQVTPYMRIMRAAEAGRGLRLTADEVAAMSIDDAISRLAQNDRDDYEASDAH